MLMNYHIGRLVLSSLCVGVFAAADIWWCSLLFLFVLVCNVVRFVLCFIWCRSFCIIVGGKPLRWAHNKLNKI